MSVQIHSNVPGSTPRARMAGEYDEIDEIVHLWNKAQQHPRGPARPSHYTYLRGDLVAWLCDWWDLLGNWTLSGYLTNVSALAIEYCDNFHALEFDSSTSVRSGPSLLLSLISHVGVT